MLLSDEIVPNIFQDHIKFKENGVLGYFVSILIGVSLGLIGSGGSILYSANAGIYFGTDAVSGLQHIHFL